MSSRLTNVTNSNYALIGSAIVLDDISEKMQLEYLVSDNIGNGSRVIITTRDEGVLRGTDITRAAFDKYKVKVLSSEEAFMIFNVPTFGEKPPLEDYKMFIFYKVENWY